MRGDEPGDHGIGRSRGGLTTKTHALVDGHGRPLVLIVSPGQAGDSPVLPRLLAELRVVRCGPGRPRTTPDRLRGDKAYSLRGTRAPLRCRGVVTVIPEPADQAATASAKAPAAAGPSATTVRTTRTETSSSGSPTAWRSGAVWPVATDKHALVYRSGVVLAAILDWRQ